MRHIGSAGTRGRRLGWVWFSIGVILFSQSCALLGGINLPSLPPTPAEALLPETGGTVPFPDTSTPSPPPTASPTRDPQATLVVLPTQFPQATVITKANVRRCAGRDCAIELTLDVGDKVFILGRAEEDPIWVLVASPKWEGLLFMHESTLTAGAPLP